VGSNSTGSGFRSVQVVEARDVNLHSSLSPELLDGGESIRIQKQKKSSELSSNFTLESSHRQEENAGFLTVGAEITEKEAKFSLLGELARNASGYREKKSQFRARRRDW
jgi:hypothetical protein